MNLCNIKKLIKFIQCHLGDESGIHWDDSKIFGYIQLAIAQIFSDDKDAFSKPVEVTLQPGCIQNICELGCDGNFSGFIRILTDGQECEEPDELDEDVAQLDKFYKDICPSEETEGPYQLKSVKTDPDDPCIIILDPPVPEGETIKALIGCSSLPDIDITDDLPSKICEKINLVVQLILHYSYGMDSEANVNLERAQFHFRNYLALKNLELGIEDRDEKDTSETG